MKYLMWALVSILLLAACSNNEPTSQEQSGAKAQLLNLQEYQQENSYAFECNTTGFEPHTYEWDFGDGTERTTTYRGVAHTYFKSGTYTVTCLASDDERKERSSITITVAVPEFGSYEPDDLISDLDLVDLLSDPSDTDGSRALNYTLPPSKQMPPPQQTSTDDYDDIFDFDFDEQDDTAPNTSTNESNTTTTNTTNATNQTNQTVVNQTNQTTVNQTNNTPTNNTPVNETPANSTPIDTTPVVNITPEVETPVSNGTGNSSKNRDKDEDKRDDDEEEHEIEIEIDEDDEEKDEDRRDEQQDDEDKESQSTDDSDDGSLKSEVVAKGKLKKMPQLNGLKIKLR